MGHIEEKNRKRERNRQLKALVLGTAAVAGGIAVALVAPNVLGAMAKLGLMPKTRQDEYIHAARKRLKKQGLLVERGGFLRITSKGQRQLRALALGLARPARLKRWDHKWRMLIFDVPERRRHIRAGIRRQLYAAGFARIQDSVWLYPYPCEEFVALLKSELRIGKDLLYLIVDAMEGDTKFREAFGLPRDVHDRTPVKFPEPIDAILDAVLPMRKR